MKLDVVLSMDGFGAWERTARAESEAPIAAFEAAGNMAEPERARATLALIERAVIVAIGGHANDLSAGTRRTQAAIGHPATRACVPTP